MSLEDKMQEWETQKVFSVQEELNPTLNVIDFRNRDKLQLVLISDEHIGSKYYNPEKHIEVLKWCEQTKSPIILLGDELETATRDSIGAGVYEQQEILDEQVDHFLTLYKPLAEQELILGMHPGNHECVEETTEVLTDKGFVAAKYITDNDLIASFNKDTQIIEFNKPKKITKNKTATLWSIKGNLSNEIVSSTHRLLINNKLINITKINNSESRNRLLSGFVKKRLVKCSLEEAKFLIWLISGGTIVKRDGLIHHLQFKLSKKRKINGLINLLKSLNIKHTIKKATKSTFNILQPYIIRIYSSYAKKYYTLLNGKKEFPDWFKFLPNSYFDQLLKTFSETDGYKISKNSIVFKTTNKNDADIIQQLCIFNNCACKIYKKDNMSGFKKRCKKQYHITIYKKPFCYKNIIKPLNIAGKVVAITTKNDTLITRINGVVNFTGNSRVYKSSGLNLTKMLAKQLGVKYLGWGKMHYIRVGNQHYTMYTTHGASGATMPHTKIKACIKLADLAEAEIYCFDTETEILTEDGWKSVKTIKKSDIPITFNLKTQKLEKDKILEIINKKEKEMIYFKNRFCDFKFSKKHRMVTKSIKGTLIVDEAISMKDKVRRIIHASELQKTKRRYSDDEMRLFGWLISEGSFRKYGLTISQLKENSKEIIKLLNKLKIKYSVYHLKRTISSKEMVNFYIHSKDAKKIKKILPSKKIPKHFIDITNEEFECFLETLIAGDGSINGNGFIYYSSDEEIIDMLQILCTLHNYRSIKKERKNSGFSIERQFKLLINPKIETTINGGLEWYKKTLIIEGGDVWSINTKNTTLIVRRRGKVCITGNCMGHVHQLSHHVKNYYVINKRNRTVEEAQKHFLLTGSYCRHWGSYGHMKSYEPMRQGSPKVKFSGVKHQIRISI